MSDYLHSIVELDLKFECLEYSKEDEKCLFDEYVGYQLPTIQNTDM